MTPIASATPMTTNGLGPPEPPFFEGFRLEAPVAEAGGTAGAAAQGPPISLSSASLEQLDTLDGVGPATAQKILDWRREHGGFRSVDDLGQVPGIGPKRLAALRERVQP